MNISRFISAKISSKGGGGFSNVIIRVAIAAVSLSVAVMILSTSVVKGFKNTISEKIFGFWGHIHITGTFTASHYAFEALPMSVGQNYYPYLDTVKSINSWYSGKNGQYQQKSKGGIKHIQRFANKEGIIKTNEEIEGIILRGIGEDYRWEFLKTYIKKGDTLQTKLDHNGIIISEISARRLKLALNDSFNIYFVEGENSLARRFVVRGIYKTGLEEYDRRFALVSINQIQQLNNWRPYKNFGQEINIETDSLKIIGFAQATLPAKIEQIIADGKMVNWDDSQTREVLISEAYAKEKNYSLGQQISLSYKDIDGDSCLLTAKIVGFHQAQKTVQQNENKLNWDKVVFTSLNTIQSLNEKLPAQISGFEIFIDNIADMQDYGHYINDELLVGKSQYASTIKELEPNIFDWLNLTDMNERIILVLMMLVAVINMTTALMILILERTNMIGILKSLGATNWQIRKLFLYYAARIVGWGLLWGNVLGLGMGMLQQYFGLLKLPEDLYYVSVAPIELDWEQILFLNGLTLAITLIFLLLPSYLVSTISPVKAIQFK
jgi:lipoprotein-releasing system permease protein